MDTKFKPTLSSEKSFMFLCNLLSSESFFIYAKSARSFYKAFFTYIQHIPNIHYNSLKQTNSFSIYPHLNHKQFHDTIIYTLIINFNSFFCTNVPLLNISFDKICVILAKMFTQSNYTPSLFISIMKCMLLLSTVKVNYKGKISCKNHNIKNHFLYEKVFTTLLNAYILYNRNEFYNEEQAKCLCEFINYFNETYIKTNMSNVIMILNYSNSQFKLFSLMAHFLTKTKESFYNEVKQAILNLLINIYKCKFNYASCMKYCIELSMNAYTNFNTSNTLLENKVNVHLIDFPISFITKLIECENNNSYGKVLNDTFYFNSAQSGVFIEDYFDFGFAYYVISANIFPKDNKHSYTLLQFDKKDDGDKIEVSFIKNGTPSNSNEMNKRIFFPNDKEKVINDNSSLYRLIIQMSYKKKPQNDFIIETCVYIEPFVNKMLIIHFDKDKVEIYDQNEKINTYEKKTINIKAFTKSKMKLSIGCNSSLLNENNKNISTFNGLIGPVICIKELNKDDIQHIFLLGGNYERILFGDKYDFSHEMKYFPDNADLYFAFSYYILHPIPNDNILLFISPRSFQFIPYEDYYIKYKNKKTNNNSYIFKKSNYPCLRSTKNFSLKSKFGICCKYFHQKFSYVKHAYSQYELLRYDGISFLTLNLEFYYQFLLYYENDIQTYMNNFYKQIVDNLNNLFECIKKVLSDMKVFYFINDIRKMFYILNKLVELFCKLNGNISDILNGLSVINNELASGFLGSTAYNEESKQNIESKAELYKCFCEMLLNTAIYCNDAYVLISKLFPLMENIKKYSQLLNESILDKMLVCSDIVYFNSNSNESYINCFNNFIFDLLSFSKSSVNESNEHYILLINYFYTNYIDKLRLEHNDKETNENNKECLKKYYIKLYQFLLILYKPYLWMELNNVNLNGFIELYEETKNKLEYIDNDTELLNIINKTLKVIVLIFLELATSDTNSNLLKNKIHKLKELPCTLQTIETIISSMITIASTDEVIEFNSNIDFFLNFSQDIKQCSSFIAKFNLIISILCRNMGKHFLQYQPIYNLIIKCFNQIAKLNNQNHPLYNQFFSYKQHICVSFFAKFLFYSNCNINSDINTTSWEKDEEFKSNVKNHFLQLSELLMFDHPDPFTLYLIKSVLMRNYYEVNSTLAMDLIVEILNIINHKSKDNVINRNYFANLIEILQLIQYSFNVCRNEDVCFYNKEVFIEAYYETCKAIFETNVIYLKLYNGYLDLPKKVTLNEIIFDFLLKLYQDLKEEKHLNSLLHLFLINKNTQSSYIKFSDISSCEDKTKIINEYKSLLYEIDLWEFKYVDKYKIILDNISGEIPLESIGDFLLTQFYLGKIMLYLYQCSKTENLVNIESFYNIFGEILFNDYISLLSENKFIKRNKKKKSENILYEQIRIIHDKMKSKQKTFDIFKKMCFDYFDKNSNIETYIKLPSYSLLKKMKGMSIDNSNINTSISGGNSSVNSGGRSPSTSREDLYGKPSSFGDDFLFLYENEGGSLDIEFEITESGNGSSTNISNVNNSTLTSFHSQINNEYNKEQTVKTSPKQSFFMNLFNKKSKSSTIEQNVNNNTNVNANNNTSKGNFENTKINSLINNFSEISINNCILSPKKEILMSHFGNVFKDIYFYNEEFIKMKEFYIKTILLENTKTKQLNYPCKIRNFSNSFEPPIFLKQDNHFFNGNPYFDVSYSYYINKWNSKNEKTITIKKHHIKIPENLITESNTFKCELISPEKNIFGHIILLEKYMIFENLQKDPRNHPNINIQLDYIFSSLENDIISKQKQIIIFYTNITEILIRRFLLMWQGTEIYLKDGRSYFFNLFSIDKQKEFSQSLQSTLQANIDCITTILSPKAISKQIKHEQHKWENGTISVYDYLLRVNKYASRTYKDINQYPIFPWVSTNISFINNLFNLVDDTKDRFPKTNFLEITLHDKYISAENDDKQKIKKRKLRLFNLPISVQNEDKRKLAMERYRDNVFDDKFPFHLGNHYSTSSFIYFYLMRLSPFNNMLINLQGGILENPNRTFLSFKDTVQILKNSSDNRELIPEIFVAIEYMINLNCVYYGRKFGELGILVDDLIFRKDIRSLEMYVQFLFQHKKLLNSSNVANEIHIWLNYVFGMNQISEDETSCTNFQKSTYAQKINLYKKKEKYLNTLTPIQVKQKLKSKITFIINFGQTPHKIFTLPHPKYKNEIITTEEHQNEDGFLLLKGIRQQEHVDNSIKDNIMQFSYVNISFDKKFIYYVYVDMVLIKKFLPNEQIKTIEHSSITNLQKNTLFRKKILDIYKFKLTSNIPRRYKTSIFSPEYCYILINSYFISCRYLDYTFKIYEVTQNENYDLCWSIYISSFVSAICKINENTFITGHNNGKLIEWEIYKDEISKTKKTNKKNANPKCIQLRNICSHDKAITVIEYYPRFNIIITASDDNYIYVRKYFDFELMCPIHIENKYKIMSVKISSLNMMYVLCYNGESKQNVVFAFTINGIKFAESGEGVYTNIQFTRNGNVIVGNCDNGCVEILTAFALNVIGIAKIKNGCYKDSKEKEGMVDMVWIKFLIEDDLLIVGTKRGVVFYYKMLADEPENKIYS